MGVDTGHRDTWQDICKDTWGVWAVAAWSARVQPDWPVPSPKCPSPARLVGPQPRQSSDHLLHTSLSFFDFDAFSETSSEGGLAPVKPVSPMASSVQGGPLRAAVT